jgi:hypothetical protein
MGERASSARPTLEDFGMLADGLVSLALATGEVRFANRAWELVEECRTDGGFLVPGGADSVLVRHGLALDGDPSEGAYPSGLSAIARAATRLAALGAPRQFLDAARTAVEPIAPLAAQRAISFGAALGVMSMIVSPTRQLVVIDNSRSPLRETAAAWRGGTVAVVTSAQAEAFASAGFELFESRVARNGGPTAYLCEDFVCRLPVTSAKELAAMLTPQR